MKSVKLFFIVSALCILAVDAYAAAASIVLPDAVMQFQLTATRQDLLNEEVRPDVYHSTIRAIRITNKEVLRAMQIHYVLPVFPTGARLITGSSTLMAVAPDGTVLATAPFNVAGSSWFIKEVRTPKKKSTQRLTQATSVPIALGTKLNFTLSGLFKDDVSENYVSNMSSAYIVTMRQLVGMGAVDSVSFLFEGTISGQRPARPLID